MSSGFVTEAEIEAKKKARQEEWERVRKPEDPKEAPEEPVDNRSLFERLEANRIAKQEIWDEEHKLKNQIRGINSDEAEFLSTVDDIRSHQEKEKMREEAKALAEFNEKQSKLLEEKEKLKRKEALGKSFKSRFSSKKSDKSNSKSSLGVVKRSLPTEEETDVKRPKEEVQRSNALSGLLGDYSSSDSE